MDILKNSNNKHFKKEFNGFYVHLEYGFDFKHGLGWFCMVYNPFYKRTFYFSKNKFTAVKQALKQANFFNQ